MNNALSQLSPLLLKKMITTKIVLVSQGCSKEMSIISIKTTLSPNWHKEEEK